MPRPRVTKEHIKARKLAFSRKWYATNKERLVEVRKTQRSQIKNRHLKWAFGITLNDYNQMCEKQNNLCAICNKSETKKHGDIVRKLAVDHDHSSGKIRGLLCTRCNAGIGSFEDNIELLNDAINYLTKHK